ncbi:restriction endonuclease subunit S [Mycoplasmopsis bovis]|uniref:restriction endonuclease subunit S n=1 Tax=Mycoplasmopsis bovis TaxID=28903 RepID=UPI00279E186A
MGNLTKFTTGQSFKSHIDSNGIYTVMDMGGIDIEGNRIENKRTNLLRDLLDKGDLIMCKDDIGGGQIIGRTCYIPENNKYVLGDHVFKLSFSKQNSLFIHYLINSPIFNTKVRLKAAGSAQLGLNLSTIQQEIIAFTIYEEQSKISSLFTHLDSLITLHQRG